MIVAIDGKQIEIKERDRNKKRLEYIAKLVLEEYYPDKFSKLMLCESPDLWLDDENGVEVTEVTFYQEKYVIDKFRTVVSKTENDVDKKAAVIIEELGYELLYYHNPRKVVGYSPNFEIKQIAEIALKQFEGKLKKCKNYKKNTDLFMFFPYMWFDEMELNKVTSQIITKNKKADYKLNSVYLFDYESLYKCDLITEDVNSLKVNEFLINQIKEKANKVFGFSK